MTIDRKDMGMNGMGKSTDANFVSCPLSVVSCFTYGADGLQVGVQAGSKFIDRWLGLFNICWLVLHFRYAKRFENDLGEIAEVRPLQNSSGESKRVYP